MFSKRKPMGTATVAFRKCVINSQAHGPADDSLTSRVFFDLDIDGEGYANVYVDVRQSTEPGLEEAPLEISDLYGYEGPFNYEVFRGSLEFYFRQAIGGKESMFRTQGKFLTLTDWTIEQEMLVKFEVLS